MHCVSSTDDPLNRLVLTLFLLGCSPKNPSVLTKQLDAEVVALHQVVRDLKGQVATCGQATSPDSIYADLHQVFKGTEISVSRQAAVTVVTLPVSTLFSDPYTLAFRSESDMTLDLLATAIKLHPDQRVVLEGHTDNAMLPRDWVRRYGSHLELSFLYAAAVMQRLNEQFDVDEDRFTVSARGQWAPIASNDVSSGQSANRRVEVHIMPNDSLNVELP